MLFDCHVAVCCDPQTQLPLITTVARPYIMMLFAMTTAMMMYLCRPNSVLQSLSPPDCHGLPRRLMYSSPPPRWPPDPWHGTRACPGSAPGRRTTDEASQRWPTARTTPIKYKYATNVVTLYRTIIGSKMPKVLCQIFPTLNDAKGCLTKRNTKQLNNRRLRFEYCKKKLPTN